MAVERTSHLGKGAVDGRGDVDTSKAGVVQRESCLIRKLYPLSPNALFLLRFINNAGGQEVFCILDL